MFRKLLAGCVLITASGCANLTFYKATDDVPRGVRVRAPVSCIVVKEITRKSGAKQKVEEIALLPLGEAYDINVKRGWFSATEFSVSLSEQGTLKQVTLNADPQVDETIKAVADVLDKVPVLNATRGDEEDPVVTEAIIEVRRLKLTD